MKMNRRNVLAGLGGLAVGGGALLGSGAFSSVDAQRDVEVNVAVDNEIGDDGFIADVLIDVAGFNSVAVDDGSINTDGSGLFPTGSSNYTSPSYGSGYVSLIQNNVTIVFGHTEGTDDSQLLPNATHEFDNLIALVNSASQQTTGYHELQFGQGSFNNGSSVQFNRNGLSSPSHPQDVQVGATSSIEYNVDVTSVGTDDSSSGEFRIGITDTQLSS